MAGEDELRAEAEATKREITALGDLHKVLMAAPGTTTADPKITFEKGMAHMALENAAMFSELSEKQLSGNAATAATERATAAREAKATIIGADAKKVEQILEAARLRLRATEAEMAAIALSAPPPLDPAIKAAPPPKPTTGPTAATTGTPAAAGGPPGTGTAAAAAGSATPSGATGAAGSATPPGAAGSATTPPGAAGSATPSGAAGSATPSGAAGSATPSGAGSAATAAAAVPESPPRKEISYKEAKTKLSTLKKELEIVKRHMVKQKHLVTSHAYADIQITENKPLEKLTKALETMEKHSKTHLGKDEPIIKPEMKELVNMYNEIKQLRQECLKLKTETEKMLRDSPRKTERTAFVPSESSSSDYLHDQENLSAGYKALTFEQYQEELKKEHKTSLPIEHKAKDLGQISVLWKEKDAAIAIRIDGSKREKINSAYAGVAAYFLSNGYDKTLWFDGPIRTSEEKKHAAEFMHKAAAWLIVNGKDSRGNRYKTWDDANNQLKISGHSSFKLDKKKVQKYVRECTSEKKKARRMDVYRDHTKATQRTLKV